VSEWLDSGVCARLIWVKTGWVKIRGRQGLALIDTIFIFILLWLRAEVFFLFYKKKIFIGSSESWGKIKAAPPLLEVMGRSHGNRANR